MTDIRARIKTIIERELSVDNRDEISGVNDAVYALTALFSEREKELVKPHQELCLEKHELILKQQKEIADLRRQLTLANEEIKKSHHSLTVTVTELAEAVECLKPLADIKFSQKIQVRLNA